MKIYPLNITEYNIDFNKMMKFKHKEINNLLLFTLNGIVEVDNRIPKLLKIIDGCVKRIYLRDVIFLCDESKYIVDGECFQIPKNHVAKTVRKTYYRTHPKSPVELVIETTPNCIEDRPLVYFLTKKNDISPEIENEIFSLLTVLKSSAS